MKTTSLLMIAIVGVMAASLTGCISGKPKDDTYTHTDGTTTEILSDKEQCERSCNASQSRCMDTTDARTNGGVNGPQGMFGASSDCRNDLSGCLKGCKAR